MFILHDYTIDVILVEAIKQMTNKSMIATFNNMITKLTKRRFKPKLNIVNNVTTTAITQFFENINEARRTT